MNDKILQALIELLRAEISQEPLRQETVELIKSIDLMALYRLSFQHDLAHLVADALEASDLLREEDPASELFETQKMLAFFRYKQLSYEYGRICQALESEKIRFLPLKGSEIRPLYPEEWMRTSCDIDILIDPENVERAEKVLKKELKYHRSGQSLHDISLYSSNEDVHLELHFSLIDDKELPGVTEIVSRVWEYTSPAEHSEYQMKLSNEMLYFYHVAHLAKHVMHGGCGIRFFLDARIITDRLPLDTAVQDVLFRGAELLQFETCIRGLSDAWFGDAEMTEDLQTFQRFIVDNGSYGTVETRLSINPVSRSSGRFRYFMYRAFPPKQTILDGYPIVKKHPWLLLPFYVIRPFHRFFTSRGSSVFSEIKAQTKVSDQTKNSVDTLFGILGLPVDSQ